MAIDKSELRRVMGHFATGVTVVTTVSKEGKLHGFTANAFTSLSLVPPLVLICVDKKAESHDSFRESGVFAVNILNDEQESISRHFAISGGDKFQAITYHLGGNGSPIIDGALTHMECKLHAAYEGGDHTIYLGEVEAAETREGRPLLFFRGGYRALGD